MIEMGMDRGNNLGVVLMLNVRQLLGKKAAMVIVDERDCSYDFRVRCQNGRCYKVIANEVAKRLRSIRIALVGDEPIKLLQERSVNGNPCPAQPSHNGRSHFDVIQSRLTPQG